MPIRDLRTSSSVNWTNGRGTADGAAKRWGVGRPRAKSTVSIVVRMRWSVVNQVRDIPGEPEIGEERSGYQPMTSLSILRDSIWSIWGEQEGESIKEWEGEEREEGSGMTVFYSFIGSGFAGR